MKRSGRHDVAWSAIERFPDGVEGGEVGFAGVDGEVSAVSPDGQLRWVARRSSRLSMYSAPGDRGMPMLHGATVVDHEVRASADGGATWCTVDRPSGAAGLAIDGRGRVWLAWAGGVDVADAREAMRGGREVWRTVTTTGAGCIAVDGGGRIVIGTGGAAWLSRDGERFAAMSGKAREAGAWGSMEVNAMGMRALRTAPDGAVWGVLADGLVRLAPDATEWASVNLGLTLIAGKGMRGSQVWVTVLAFGADGAAYCETRSHGRFRRAASAA